METAETKTVDNQTAAAPQQYTIVPDDSKPIFEDDTLLCELCACGHLPPSLHTTRLTPALPFPPPTSRVSDPSTLTFDQPLSTCPSLPRASPSTYQGVTGSTPPSIRRPQTTCTMWPQTDPAE